jgi:aryl carrier-like protein
LGEVETVLTDHPGLAAVAAGAPPGPDGAARLVAWVAPLPDVPAPSADELRAFCATRLPEPMVPSVFVAVDALPLNASGKLDRAALPDPPASRPNVSVYAPPPPGAAQAVAEAWAEALGVERVGADDNFFDLGGHSLLLASVQEGIRRRLGVEVSLVSLFQHPTVRLLARAIDGMPEVSPDIGLDVSARGNGRFRRASELLERRHSAREGRTNG